MQKNRYLHAYLHRLIITEISRYRQREMGGGDGQTDKQTHNYKNTTALGVNWSNIFFLDHVSLYLFIFRVTISFSLSQ